MMELTEYPGQQTAQGREIKMVVTVLHSEVGFKLILSFSSRERVRKGDLPNILSKKSRIRKLDSTRMRD